MDQDFWPLRKKPFGECCQCSYKALVASEKIFAHIFRTIRHTWKSSFFTLEKKKKESYILKSPLSHILEVFMEKDLANISF